MCRLMPSRIVALSLPRRICQISLRRLDCIIPRQVATPSLGKGGPPHCHMPNNDASRRNQDDRRVAMKIGTAKPTAMVTEGRPTRRRRSFGGSPEIHVTRASGDAGLPQKACMHLWASNQLPEKGNDERLCKIRKPGSQHPGPGLSEQSDVSKNKPLPLASKLVNPGQRCTTSEPLPTNPVSLGSSRALRVEGL